MPEMIPPEADIEILPPGAAAEPVTEIDKGVPPAPEPPRQQRQPEPRAEDEEARRRRYTVKRSIDRMTGKMRELERQLWQERSMRLEAENRALYADHAAIDAMEQAVDSQLGAAKREMTEAQSNGDPAQIAEATTRIAIAAARKAEAERIRAITGNNKRAPNGQAPQAPQQRGTPPMPAPAGPGQSGPMTQAWFQEHPQFFTDPGYQSLALSIDQTVKALGYQPETPEYYEEINRRMELETEGLDVGPEEPHPSDDPSQADMPAPPPPKAAPAPVKERATLSRQPAATAPSRTPLSGQNRQPARAMRLTEEELAFARSLNVTPVQYWNGKFGRKQ